MSPEQSRNPADRAKQTASLRDLSLSSRLSSAAAPPRQTHPPSTRPPHPSIRRSPAESAPYRPRPPHAHQAPHTKPESSAHSPAAYPAPKPASEPVTKAACRN